MSAGGGPACRPCSHGHALLHTRDEPWSSTPELSTATPSVHTFCCLQVVDLQPGAISRAVLELEEVLEQRFVDVSSPEVSSCCFWASRLGCVALLPDSGKGMWVPCSAVDCTVQAWHQLLQATFSGATELVFHAPG